MLLKQAYKDAHHTHKNQDSKQFTPDRCKFVDIGKKAHKDISDPSLRCKAVSAVIVTVSFIVNSHGNLRQQKAIR